MDRCRCEEYKAAVEKLRIYTVGTFRQDIIENYNRKGFDVGWIKHGVDYSDMKFSKPKARKVLQLHELPENILPKECRKIEHMWCPFMTPVKQGE